jgi:hypothetical protein
VHHDFGVVIYRLVGFIFFPKYLNVQRIIASEADPRPMEIGLAFAETQSEVLRISSLSS